MKCEVPPAPAELVESMKDESFTLQRAFTFRRHKWLEWLESIPGAVAAIEGLPDEVDRAAIKKAFREHEKDNIEGAFASVMVWGYGNANLGPSRTLRILSNDSADGQQLSADVTATLRHSVTVARDDGAVAGYSYLNNEGRIKHFRGSYVTKWLYYATATGPEGEQNAAPILDKLIRVWLAKKINVELRANRTDDYECYVHILTTWGKPFGLTAVEVEERIFRIIRGGTN